MKIKYLFFFFILVGCSPGIHTSLNSGPMKPLDDNTNVLVIDALHNAPDSSVLLGKIKTGSNMFTTDCGYDELIVDLKKSARKMGGNVVKITEVLQPDVHNSCYRIKANILYCNNLDFIATKLRTVEDSITRSKFPANPTYALLYIYRPEVPDGYSREYNVHLNDSIICRVKNNAKFKIKLNKKGINAIWAETEARDSVLINVKFGEEYFLKCTLKMGVIIGRPDMELIPKEQGRLEYGN